MKKLFLMLLCMPATLGWAYDFEADGVYYNITSSTSPRTCAVTRNDSIDGPSYTGTVSLPSKASDGTHSYSLTAIADSAFAGCSKLTSISLSSNIEKIGNNAFENCTKLSSLAIPSKVAEIGEKAFAGCTKLRTIWCAKTPTQLKDNTFEGVDKTIAKVYMTMSAVETYQADSCWNTFDNLIGYTTINYYSTDSTTVKAYKTPAFLDANGKGLNIIYNSYSKTSDKGTMRVDGVPTALGDSAFWGRNDLKEFVMNETIESWGADALTGTTWWENQPAGMYYNGTTAYKYKEPAEADSILKIAEGTTAINANALSDSNSVQILFVPASVEKIGNNAFAGCNNLKTIYCEAIPAQADSATFAGINTAACNIMVPMAGLEAYQAAPYWKDLTNLKGYQTSQLTYSSTDSLIVTPHRSDAFFDAEGEQLLILSNEYDIDGGTITFAGKLDSIGYAAFAACENIEKFDIPGTVRVIGESAFKNCTGMTKVSLHSGIEKICESAFEGCSAITGINIPSTTKVIEEKAFAGCKSATYLYMPTDGASFADDVFLDCPRMSSVSVLENPGTITNKTFTVYMKTLAVPYGCYYQFKNDKNWGKISKIYEYGVTNVEEVSAMEDIEIQEGGKVQLLAEALPEEVQKATIGWRSSNTKVATVDAEGVVKAISVGEAVITAYTFTATVKSSSCKVTVNPIKASAISLNESDTCLYVGETLLLNATIQPETTTDTSVFWTSSDKDVATVKDGLVEATGVGSVVITALTTDGSDLSAICTITVLPVLATKLTLNHNDEAMLQGDTLLLIATLAPENVTYTDIEWTSSDEKIATVENGMVIARGGGLVKITASTTDGSNLVEKCFIEVTPVESISSIFNDQENESYYDVNGTVTTNQHRGLTIVRKADGKVQKVMVK